MCRSLTLLLITISTNCALGSVAVIDSFDEAVRSATDIAPGRDQLIRDRDFFGERGSRRLTVGIGGMEGSEFGVSVGNGMLRFYGSENQEVAVADYDFFRGDFELPLSLDSVVEIDFGTVAGTHELRIAIDSADGNGIVADTFINESDSFTTVRLPIEKMELRGSGSLDEFLSERTTSFYVGESPFSGQLEYLEFRIVPEPSNNLFIHLVLLLGLVIRTGCFCTNGRKVS